MCDILVDTNVIVGFYKEDVLGMDAIYQNLTGSPVTLFEKIDGNQDIIFLDDRGAQESIIENEWRRHIPDNGKEWFDNWFFDLVHDGNVKYIEVDVSSARNILNILYRSSFPRDGGDKWYVRTAITLVNSNCLERRHERDDILAQIISEDIDFFEPAQKNRTTGDERLELLRRCNGEVPTILRNNGIGLSCIENY